MDESLHHLHDVSHSLLLPFSLVRLTDPAIRMGVASNSPPNWEAVIASGYADAPGPIYHYAGTPPDKTISDQVNGLMQAVFSYGGATLFTNLMAEMRRP